LALSLALALPAGIALSPDTPLEGARPAAAGVSILLSLDSLVEANPGAPMLKARLLPDKPARSTLPVDRHQSVTSVA